MQKDEGHKNDRVTIQRPFLKREHCSKKKKLNSQTIYIFRHPICFYKNILWPKWTLIKPFNQK